MNKPPPSPLPAVLRIQDLAAHLQISIRHARRLVRDGELPAPTRLGRLHRWPREGVEAWMSRQPAARKETNQ